MSLFDELSRLTMGTHRFGWLDADLKRSSDLVIQCYTEGGIPLHSQARVVRPQEYVDYVLDGLLDDDPTPTPTLGDWGQSSKPVTDVSDLLAQILA